MGKGSPPENVHVLGAIAGAVQILTITTAGSTLLYFDRRVRKEALDVEMAMRRVPLAV